MNIFNIIIGIITVIGVIISICQIKKTRSAAQAAEIASLDTKKKVDASFLLPDIAGLIHYARFVKENAFRGSIEVARIRLQDTKDGICKYRISLSEDLRLYNKIIGDVDMCLRALEIAQSDKDALDINTFCKYIESIVSGLNEIQNIIKTKAL